NVLKSGGTRAVVAEVLPGTPAAEVDLEPGDIIRSVNGRDVSRAMDVGRILWLLEKGDEVSIQLEDGNRPVQFRVSKISAEMYVERRLGLQLQGLTAPLRKALALPEDVRGLIVSDIKKDSQQPELNVRRGDIVVKIDKTPVSTVDDVYEVIKKHRSGETLPMTLLTAETRQERRFLRQLTIGIRLE
ncbi:MAG: PDZ domain-containing protein, partial [bacterium]